MALDAPSFARLISVSIAAALGLGLQGQAETIEQVVHYLGDKRLLLVLDNYEHLLEGATLAWELLRGCPSLKLLVTSRERLDLEEWVLPLEGLAYPAEAVPENGSNASGDKKNSKCPLSSRKGNGYGWVTARASGSGPNHVWAYNFVTDRAADGKAFRMLTVVDEYTREGLAIRVKPSFRSTQVLEALADLFVSRGPPEHIRSDNGPEFCAEAVKHWLSRSRVKTLFIEPGSPWENGYVESFNSKLRDELLNGERFTTLLEAQVLIADWRYHYNRFRPHSALDYRPPAPEATLFPVLSARYPSPQSR